MEALLETVPLLVEEELLLLGALLTEDELLVAVDLEVVVLELELLGLETELLELELLCARCVVELPREVGALAADVLLVLELCVALVGAFCTCEVPLRFTVEVLEFPLDEDTVLGLFEAAFRFTVELVEFLEGAL